MADERAVTLCTLRNKKGQARLLVPHDKQPVHAFNKTPMLTPDEYEQILKQA